MTKAEKHKKKGQIKFFKTILLLLMCVFFVGLFPDSTEANEVVTRFYTLSDEAGAYCDSLNLRIKASSRYKVYYTTGAKFSAKKYIKSGKSKTIKVKKNTRLRLYASKRNKALTTKQLRSDKVTRSAKSYNFSIIVENGYYTTKEDVSLYLHYFKKLPANFVTKTEAQKLGWNGGGLDHYAEGFCIGGDYFGNYESNLPEGKYHECDIDTMHQGSRGNKRLVYSDDGKIYYTEDHYDSFVLLYESW